MTSVITASIIRLKEGVALGGNGAVGRLWHINKDGTLKRNKSRSFSISCVRPVMSYEHEHPVGICLLSTRSGIVRALRCCPSLPGVEAREALRVLADSQLSSRSVWNAGSWLHLSTRTKKKVKSSKPSNWDENWDWNKRKCGKRNQCPFTRQKPRLYPPGPAAGEGRQSHQNAWLGDGDQNWGVLSLQGHLPSHRSDWEQRFIYLFFSGWKIRVAKNIYAWARWPCSSITKSAEDMLTLCGWSSEKSLHLSFPKGISGERNLFPPGSAATEPHLPCRHPPPCTLAQEGSLKSHGKWVILWETCVSFEGSTSIRAGLQWFTASAGMVWKSPWGPGKVFQSNHTFIGLLQCKSGPI